MAERLHHSLIMGSIAPLVRNFYTSTVVPGPGMLCSLTGTSRIVDPTLSSLHELLGDAQSLSDPSWNAVIMGPVGSLHPSHAICSPISLSFQGVGCRRLEQLRSCASIQFPSGKLIVLYTIACTELLPFLVRSIRCTQA
jgi:hypothetical protein